MCMRACSTLKEHIRVEEYIGKIILIGITGIVTLFTTWTINNKNWVPTIIVYIVIRLQNTVWYMLPILIIDAIYPKNDSTTPDPLTKKPYSSTPAKTHTTRNATADLHQMWVGCSWHLLIHAQVDGCFTGVSLGGCIPSRANVDEYGYFLSGLGAVKSFGG